MNTWPDITTGQKSLVVSLATVGAAVGSLFSGTASDKFGRKKVILFSDVMFTIGSALMGLAPTIPILMVGRFFVGLGVGVSA